MWIDEVVKPSYHILGWNHGIWVWYLCLQTPLKGSLVPVWRSCILIILPLFWGQGAPCKLTHIALTAVREKRQRIYLSTGIHPLAHRTTAPQQWEHWPTFKWTSNQSIYWHQLNLGLSFYAFTHWHDPRLPGHTLPLILMLVSEN